MSSALLTNIRQTLNMKILSNDKHFSFFPNICDKEKEFLKGWDHINEVLTDGARHVWPASWGS